MGTLEFILFLYNMLLILKFHMKALLGKDCSYSARQFSLITRIKRHQPAQVRESGFYNNVPLDHFFCYRFKALKCLSIVTTGSASTFLLITKAFASFIKMYLLLLFLRVLLAWFPTFNWDSQPWISLRQVTDPYLNVFRGLVPPLMGQMDLTPLIGFYVLQMLSSILMAPFADDPDIW